MMWVLVFVGTLSALSICWVIAYYLATQLLRAASFGVSKDDEEGNDDGEE